MTVQELYLTQICQDRPFVLTVHVLPCPQSESYKFVTEADRQLLRSPVESRPVTRHVHKDCRLLQMSQNPLSLFFAEGFNCSVGVHGLMLIWVLS